jgi:hypothetical protein
MTRMRVNSWYSAKLVTSGSTGSAWDTKQKTSCLRVTTTAKNVDLTNTKTFSSVFPVVFTLYLLSLMAIVTTGGCQKEVVTRLLTLRLLRHAYHAPTRHHIF